MAAKGKTIRLDLKEFFDKKKDRIHGLLINLLQNFKQHEDILSSIKRSADTNKLVKWIFDNPKCIPDIKKWLRSNDGTRILQKLGDKALAIRSKQHKEKNAKDLKFFQAWENDTVNEACIESRFAELAKDMGERFKLHEDKVKSHIDDLETRVEELSGKISQLKMELETERAERAKTEKELKAAEQRHVTAQEKLEKAQAKNGKLRKEMKVLKNEDLRKIETLEHDNAMCREQIKELEKLKHENALCREKIKELENVEHENPMQRERTKELERLEQECAMYREKIKELEIFEHENAMYRVKTKELEKLEHEIPIYRERTKELERLEHECAMYRELIKELEVKLLKSEQKINTLEQYKTRTEATLLKIINHGHEQNEDEAASLSSDSNPTSRTSSVAK